MLRVFHPFTLFSVLLAGLAPVSGAAMVLLEEDALAEVSGSGLAFVFDNFSLRQAPTSYVELIGSAPTQVAAGVGWRRGDARYYGLSFTSGSLAGTDWFSSNASGGGCNSDANSPPGFNLRCPMGVGENNDFGVTAFASVYDPFVLRVFEYTGFDYQGLYRDSPAGSNNSNAMPTILEFRGPSNTDAWRWAFWGELEVDRGGFISGNSGPQTSADEGAANCSGSSAPCAHFLQNQTIIHGRPVAQGRQWNRANNTYGAASTRPAILRLMQTLNNADSTLGITYQSALSGDFRFSVRQNGGSPNRLHQVPDFQDQEGLYFRNVDAYLPLGALHYQAITFSGVSGYNRNGQPITPSQNGNFSIELTRIPNIANIYNHFYCGATSGGCATDGAGRIANPNPDTHGYVRWGNWCTNANCTGSAINPYTATLGTGDHQLPTGTSYGNGIYFIGGANGSTPQYDPVNIGISRVEGMLIQHLKITTLGAGS